MIVHMDVYKKHKKRQKRLRILSPIAAKLSFIMIILMSASMIYLHARILGWIFTQCNTLTITVKTTLLSLSIIPVFLAMVIIWPSILIVSVTGLWTSSSDMKAFKKFWSAP